jgi:hypothetical protein
MANSGLLHAEPLTGSRDARAPVRASKSERFARTALVSKSYPFAKLRALSFSEALPVFTTAPWTSVIKHTNPGPRYDCIPPSAVLFLLLLNPRGEGWLSGRIRAKRPLGGLRPARKSDSLARFKRVSWPVQLSTSTTLFSQGNNLHSSSRDLPQQRQFAQFAELETRSNFPIFRRFHG